MSGINTVVATNPSPDVMASSEQVPVEMWSKSTWQHPSDLRLLLQVSELGLWRCFCALKWLLAELPVHRTSNGAVSLYPTELLAP